MIKYPAKRAWAQQTRTLCKTLVLLSSLAIVGLSPSFALTKIEEGNYPLMTFFRNSEKTENYNDYNSWHDRFSPLMGIEGKMVEEEITGVNYSQRRNWFNDLKNSDASQFNLVHFNGRARLPNFQSSSFFSGHWLYYEGTTIDSNISTTDIGFNVIDAKYIPENWPKTEAVICRLVNGQPDWNQAEHVRINWVNHDTNWVNVTRGLYGSTPLSFTKGEAYIAAHVTSVINGNLLWLYNYSTQCPTDSAGKTCSERLKEQINGWFSNTGDLAEFDGIEFDVMPNFTNKFDYSRAGVEFHMKTDTDGNGIGDDGFLSGINQFGIGTINFLKSLRNASNMTDKYVIADGMRWWQQRACGIVGIEAEDFPSNSDKDFVEWSTAFNQLMFWVDRANHANAFMQTNGRKHHSYAAIKKPKPTNSQQWADNLLSIAACNTVGVGTALNHTLNNNDIYDEARGDKDTGNGTLGWLGKRVGSPVRYGYLESDMLNTISLNDLKDRMSSDVGSLAIKSHWGKNRLQVKAPNGTDSFKVEIENVPFGNTNDPDLLLRFNLFGAQMSGHPEEMHRPVRVRLKNPYFLSGEKTDDVYVQHGNWNVVPWNLDSAIHNGRFYYEPLLNDENDTPKAGYRIELPDENLIGSHSSMYWEKTVNNLPDDSTLEYYARHHDYGSSDGVKFKILVKDLTAGTSSYTKIQDYTPPADNVWHKKTKSLSAYNGKDIVIRFEVYSLSTQTHDMAYWGDVRIDVPGVGDDDLKPIELVTFTNKWGYFDSSFYFRDYFYGNSHPTSGTVELTFESHESYYIDFMKAYSAPDVVAQEFENGIVVCNPSDNDAVLSDLEGDFGSQLVRIDGSSGQQPNHNNGNSINGTFTLGPRDAIFLKKQ